MKPQAPPPAVAGTLPAAAEPGQVSAPELSADDQHQEELLDGAPSTAPAKPAPVPLIATLPAAGHVVRAAAESIPAGGWLMVGETGKPRPGTLELVLIASGAGLQIQADAAGASTMPGFPIPITPMKLPTSRVNVYNPTGAAITLSFMLIGLAPQP